MNTSQQLYERARQLMPWGTQTNAKRPDESLAGIMPFFIERAEGCRVQDVDGRWYLDYRMALGPILLGYRHPVVDDAVRAQMDKGVLFSMASPVELDVAEALTALVPGIEQVRFLKTGNDANSAAVRLARAYTRRDHLVTCGYHGYGDWFACGHGATSAGGPREGNGVPEALDAFVAHLPYGDVATAERVFAERGDTIAAVLTVPYDWGETVENDFVHRLRDLTRHHGALLIFDQVLTGFRLAQGGAQEYLGVTPDLSTYAKALANGYPLSAFGGRRDVMETLYDVLITTTYAGETLSLAAAKATLQILNEEPVIKHIWHMGTQLQFGFDVAARTLGLTARAVGLPPALQFRFSDEAASDEAARHVFFRELFRRGIFAARPFLLSYAHQLDDIDETLQAMQEALVVVAEEVPASRA
ncbi:MAG: aspartate aminotransferase family protein [Rhodothermales bacterium]